MVSFSFWFAAKNKLCTYLFTWPLVPVQQKHIWKEYFISYFNGGMCVYQGGLFISMCAYVIEQFLQASNWRSSSPYL